MSGYPAWGYGMGGGAPGESSFERQWGLITEIPQELVLSNFETGEILENPLDSKEIKPVNPKRNQP